MTGDTELDVTLEELNLTTHSDSMGEFLDSLCLSWNIPRQELESLRQIPRITTGDIYMIVSLAVIGGRPVRMVSSHYEWKRNKGWGEIAHELGIKPGSPEFHRLKNGGMQELERAKGRSGKGETPPGQAKKEKEKKKKD